MPREGDGPVLSLEAALAALDACAFPPDARIDLGRGWQTSLQEGEAPDRLHRRLAAYRTHLALAVAAADRASPADRQSDAVGAGLRVTPQARRLLDAVREAR